MNRVTLVGLLVWECALSEGRDAASLYSGYCVSCHGEQMEGGLGPTLLGQLGRLAGTDEDLACHILEGSPDGAMPAFKSALSAAEAQALVVFIRERSSDRSVPEHSLDLPIGVQTSTAHSYRFETVVEGLDVPWGIAFLPDGRLIFTERRGQIFIVEAGEEKPIGVEGVPNVLVRDEGGLMDVAVHPDYVNEGWIYLTLSDLGPNDTSMTKVVRGRLRDGRWTEEQVIFEASPETYSSIARSYGGRMAFFEEYLFFSIGDRWDEAQAQELGSPKGKIHRLFMDGRVPSDNPFVETPGALPSIWSFGHRNPQGLAVDSATGDLWETEHGPRGGDELNYVGKGENYGWPLATHGINYDGSPISARTEIPSAVSPVKHWTPSIATSPVHSYSGDLFPNWKGNLFLGSLAKQQLIRFVVEGSRIIEEEIVFEKLGRIRDIMTGPDGYLYISTELPGEPGRIIRLVPAI